MYGTNAFVATTIINMKMALVTLEGISFQSYGKRLPVISYIENNSATMRTDFRWIELNW